MLHLLKTGEWSFRYAQLGDCCLRHLNTEFQEFPMNARSAPARVGETHVLDEIPNFRIYRRATFATPTLPSPIEAKSLAMPGDNRLGLTRSNADRQSFHTRESQTHRTRSAHRDG